MNTSRRRFISCLIAGGWTHALYQRKIHAAQITPLHAQIAEHAARLATGRPLHLLIPNGSGTNVRAATREFTRLSGVNCNIEEVDVDNMNMEIILRNAPGNNVIDVALPATFGLIDLIQAGAVISLDDYAERYEPPNFLDGHLYRQGDRYDGKLYGYQTDGDVYLLFYNRSMMEDPSERQAYRSLTGNELEPASTWQDLDLMMAFFHRPEQGRFGGSLFRHSAYLVWEWWARFHAKGSLPFTADMQANINNEHGVAALEELVAASAFLSPGARGNSLFENWVDFANGNVFCNIGWGGTQKFMRQQDNMRDNLIHGALPGPRHQGNSASMGYFNWGWNYTISSQSRQPELAYLLALFCISPDISTLAVRKADGYFDPFHEQHYEDEKIVDVYGESFLQAHRESLGNPVPDLYITGQGAYMDVLRRHIQATLNSELSATNALDEVARQWSHITRKLGKRKQIVQWQQLLEKYPVSMRG